MPKRLRVLHMIQNLNYGGMERLLADLVRGVNRDTVESHILVLQYFGRFAKGLDEVATLHQGPKMTRLSLLRPAALAKTIRAINPDVLHTHSGVWYKGSLAARMAGVARVIHTEHGRQSPDPWVARLLDRRASRRTDVAVGVSESVGDLLTRDIVRGPRCRVRVVLNGVNTERFHPRPDTGRIRAELGFAASVPIVGSIGRLEPIKGYDVMIDTFAELAKLGGPAANAKLVLAGDGSQRQALERKISDLGLRDRAFLVGWRDDVDDLISAFNVFAMSSRSEGTSISLLEAMSSGLCPVVTNVGGNAAVLGDALAHRLVPSEQPAALASALADALQDTLRRAADSVAARERVLSAYSVTAMVAAYERLYPSS